MNSPPFKGSLCGVDLNCARCVSDRESMGLDEANTPTVSILTAVRIL